LSFSAEAEKDRRASGKGEVALDAQTSQWAQWTGQRRFRGIAKPRDPYPLSFPPRGKEVGIAEAATHGSERAKRF
jgi:hypothetical protein